MDHIETMIAADQAGHHQVKRRLRQLENYVDPEERRKAKTGSSMLLLAQCATGQFPTPGGK